MSNEQTESNNEVKYKPTEYKDTNTNCVARGCKNAATYNIKLVLVRRSGKFCNSCKEYFEDRDLIISCSIINLGLKEVKISNEWKERNRTKGVIGATIMYITIYSNNEKTKETLYKHSNPLLCLFISTKNPKIWFVLSQKGNSIYLSYRISVEKIKNLSKLQLTSKYLTLKSSRHSRYKHHTTRISHFFTSTSGKIVTNFTKVIDSFPDPNHFQLKRYHLWS